MAKAKKLKSGNWRCKANYTINGEHKSKSFTAATKKEAEYLAQLFLNTNDFSSDSYSQLTLREAYERYIKSKECVLSPSTIAGYERMKKNNFSFIMNIKISEITKEQVQTAVSEMSANHSPKTVRNAFGLLHAVVKAYYSKLDLSDIRLPARQKVDVYIPTEQDVQKLLDVCDEYIRVPVLLASQGSLRRGEICALTSDDFTDFGVNINKSVVEDNKGVVIHKPTPKSYAGNRFVPLNKEVIKECKSWKHFGLAPKELKYHYYACIKKADVTHQFKFHALRHYWASQCHANGIPDKYICEIGGWETVEVLHRIYAHAMTDKSDKFQNKILEIFSNKTDSNNIKAKA